MLRQITLPSSMSVSSEGRGCRVAICVAPAAAPFAADMVNGSCSGFGGQKMRATSGVSNSPRKTAIPSTMEVRSLTSIFVQSR